MSTIQTTQVEDYTPYLQQLNQAKKKKNMAALQAAYEKSLSAIEAEGQGLEDTYRKAKNAAAGDSAREERNFEQYAAAKGLNGGAAGQAQLARSITLQNNLNDLNARKADKQSSLDLQRAAERRDYETGLAAAEAQAEAELAQALYEEQIRRQQAQYQADRDAVKDQQWQKEFDYQAGRDTTKDAQWQKEFVYQASRDTAKDEQWRQELDFAISKYWYDKNKSDKKEKEEDSQVKLEIPVVSPGKGMNEAHFGAAMRSITASIAQGNAEAANSGVQSIWPELTVEQRKQALEALKKQNVQIA